MLNKLRHAGDFAAFLFVGDEVRSVWSALMKLSRRDDVFLLLGAKGAVILTDLGVFKSCSTTNGLVGDNGHSIVDDDAIAKLDEFVLNNDEFN